MSQSTDVVFWRDAALPFVELRKVADGRRVCYAPHSHHEWSLGLITAGESTFVYGNAQHRVGANDLILINPETVHACNPIQGRAWGYLMLYIDTSWLTRLRYEAGLLREAQWQDISTAVLSEPRLTEGYRALAETLLNSQQSADIKHQALVNYLTDLMQQLATQPAKAEPVPEQFRRLASWLDQHAAEDVTLDDLCALSGLSAGHVIRGFRQYFHLTPHAYLINRRVQQGQASLRSGVQIATAALDAGFADQPHFQRTFKRLLATTPARYRQAGNKA